MLDPQYRRTEKNMQINGSAPADPVLVAASVDNQIDVAVAVKVRQVQKMEGEAILTLIQDAAEISQQISTGHIDVRL